MNNVSKRGRRAAEAAKREIDLKNAKIKPCPFCVGKSMGWFKKSGEGQDGNQG